MDGTAQLREPDQAWPYQRNMMCMAGYDGRGVAAAPFRVLGPLEVSGELGAVYVAPGRQEVVLGALVLR
ncbi:hypothetical protein M271_02310 [Streptomyces rapamycinicus NRRL 5491]|nr:hypothetical protein M271_02310 [Streptomyces rapamycinicus NRRL 5491]